METFQVSQVNPAVAVIEGKGVEHLVPVNKYSSLSRLVAVHGRVLMFIDKLKQRLKASAPRKYQHLSCHPNTNFNKIAWQQIIKKDQEIHYEDRLNYFNTHNAPLKDMLNIVRQLNIVSDEHKILRVHSKFNSVKF